VDLSALPDEVPVPADFVVERIRDEAALGEWVATFGAGFGLRQVEVAWFEEVLRELGLEGRDVTTWGGWQASPLRPPHCSSRPVWPASTASPPSSQPEGGASGRPSRSPRFWRRGISATPSVSLLLPRWATPSTAGSASSNTAGSVSTSGARPRPVTGHISRGRRVASKPRHALRRGRRIWLGRGARSWILLCERMAGDPTAAPRCCPRFGCYRPRVCRPAARPGVRGHATLRAASAVRGANTARTYAGRSTRPPLPGSAFR
jgi:hypothetical protein